MAKEAFSFTNTMLSNCGWTYITYNMYLRSKLNEQFFFCYLQPIRFSVPLRMLPLCIIHRLLFGCKKEARTFKNQIYCLLIKFSYFYQKFYLSAGLIHGKQTSCGLHRKSVENVIFMFEF